VERERGEGCVVIGGCVVFGDDGGRGGQGGGLGVLRVEYEIDSRYVPFFLGGKTCCAFDCTPNVDTAIGKTLRYRLRM
jgi:hypothetical protein